MLNVLLECCRTSFLAPLKKAFNRNIGSNSLSMHTDNLCVKPAFSQTNHDSITKTFVTKMYSKLKKKQETTESTRTTKITLLAGTSGVLIIHVIYRPV